MKWGCNYSKALIELLKNGELSELNYIKAGAFGDYDLEEAFAERPLLLHGFGWYERIGMNFDKVEIPHIYGGNLQKSIRRMNELAYYYESPHLGFHCLAYPQDLCDLIGTPEEVEKQLYQRMRENILFLKEHLDFPVLIENIDYVPNYDRIGQIGTLPYTAKAEVIASLVRETEVGFLFDLSHARVSAEHLGEDILEYCNKLPLDKVVEIHLSGSGIHPELGRIDVHQEMEEEDYQLIKELFKEKIPEYVTLEYGFPKDSGQKITLSRAILRQMERLHAIFVL